MQAKHILFAAGATLLMASCKNNVDFKKTKGGMPYKLFTEGKGANPVEGDILKLQFIRKINDSVLVSTYQQGAPAYIPFSTQTQPYDISEVMGSVHKGDSIYAVQLVDSFIARNPQSVPPNFKKGDKVITMVKILDIFKSQEAARKDEMETKERAFSTDPTIKAQLAKDAGLLNEYMSKNGIQATKTKNGVLVQVTAQGSGPKVETGKLVSLMYKGYTLDGNTFDTNMDNSFKHTEPLDFVVGGGQMMKGFEEAVMSLKKGDKAKVLIPSALGYGAQGNGGSIPPNSNLVFDLEVLDVKDQPAQQPSMQDPRQQQRQ
jgi:FKBP-type peptidyl-prolyl cis-trans isomerase